MPTATSIPDISDNFIHSTSEVQALIVNSTRPTKVEVQDVINQCTINLVNHPNPDGVGGIFGWAIIITPLGKWIRAELICINESRIEAAQATRRQQNATALATNPPGLPNNTVIVYMESNLYCQQHNIVNSFYHRKFLLDI